MFWVKPMSLNRVNGTMPALPYATVALVIAGSAHVHAKHANEHGNHWTGLISALMAMATVWSAGFALLRTEIGAGVYFIGVFLSLRIGLELGYSFSAIICPD